MIELVVAIAVIIGGVAGAIYAFKWPDPDPNPDPNELLKDKQS